MGAGFESQWDATWFRVRAEQCFRLAAGQVQAELAATLETLGKNFEAQAKLAQELQSMPEATNRAAAPSPGVLVSLGD